MLFIKPKQVGLRKKTVVVEGASDRSVCQEGTQRGSVDWLEPRQKSILSGDSFLVTDVITSVTAKATIVMKGKYQGGKSDT